MPAPRLREDRFRGHDDTVNRNHDTNIETEPPFPHGFLVGLPFQVPTDSAEEP